MNRERSTKEIIRSAISDIEYALEYRQSRRAIKDELEKRGWSFVGHLKNAWGRPSVDEEIYMEDKGVPNAHVFLLFDFIDGSYRVYTLEEKGRF